MAVAMKVRITSLRGMLSVGCRMALSLSGASIGIDMDVGSVWFKVMYTEQSSLRGSGGTLGLAL